jgi:hypothetical protein
MKENITMDHISVVKAQIGFIWHKIGTIVELL